MLYFSVIWIGNWDVQNRNPNINDRYHLVGLPTRHKVTYGTPSNLLQLFNNSFPKSTSLVLLISGVWFLFEVILFELFRLCRILCEWKLRVLVKIQSNAHRWSSQGEKMGTRRYCLPRQITIYILYFYILYF